MSNYNVTYWGDAYDPVTFLGDDNSIVITEQARFAAYIGTQAESWRNTVYIAGEVTPGTGNVLGSLDWVTLHAKSGVGDNVLAVADGGKLIGLINTDAAAARLDGSGNHVANSGEILGGVGILAVNWRDGTIENHGALTGLNGPAIRMLDGGGDNILLNTGTISGDGGIELANLSAHIFNSGTILSTSASDAPINAGAAEGLVLHNTGLVTGSGYAVLGSFSNDRVVNAGIIDGDVLLGGGADQYQGRNGSVEGAVHGMDGNDTLAGGAEDDALYGDRGRDRIGGGAGDDTLGGGGNADIFVFGRGDGNDRVADFIDGVDRLDLSALQFESFADLAAHAKDVTAGLRLSLGDGGGGTVLLEGMTAALFDGTDVLL